MERTFKIFSSVYENCPTCVKNFQKSICALNCSPKQSQHLTPYIAEIETEIGASKLFARFFINFISNEKCAIVFFYFQLNT